MHRPIWLMTKSRSMLTMWERGNSNPFSWSRPNTVISIHDSANQRVAAFGAPVDTRGRGTISSQGPTGDESPPSK